MLAGEHLAVLERLYQETREQLQNEDFGLELLLPDESDDFGLRLLGLSGWCQGFLYGIGVIGIADVAVSASWTLRRTPIFSLACSSSSSHRSSSIAGARRLAR